MSDWLTHKIQIWETIEIKWPVGHYTDPQNHPNYLFVSVGSGLSPNLGLFQHLVYESKKYHHIVNIFWERYQKHLVPYIQDIFLDHGQHNITNMFYLSQEDRSPFSFQERGWGGELIYHSGHVQDWLEPAISLLGTQTSCFLCGKPEMVDDVSSRLQAMGIAKSDITFEKY